MMETEYGRTRRGKASRFIANGIAECPGVSIPKCRIAQRNRQLMSVRRRTHGGGLPCFIRGEHLDDDRKVIGDFACHLHGLLGLEAR